MRTERITLYEDFLDDIEAVSPDASKKLTDEIDDENPQKKFPSPDYFDLLFRITFKQDEYPNPLFRFSYFRNFTESGTEARVDSANKYIRNIKNNIYYIADNSRFVDEISEVLFCPTDLELAEHIDELSSADQVELGYDFVDPAGCIFIIFAVKFNNTNSAVKQCMKFIDSLYNFLNRKIFEAQMNIKITRPLTKNSWYYGIPKNYFTIVPECYEFLKTKGQSSPDTGAIYFGTLFYLADIIRYPDNDFITKEVEALVPHFDISKYMFRRISGRTLNYNGVYDKISAYLPESGEADLRDIIKFAVDQNRKIQYGCVKYAFFPTFRTALEITFNANPEEREYKLYSDIRDYIENLNDYILEGNTVRITDAAFTFGGESSRTFSEALLLRLDLPDYSDGAPIREVFLSIKFNIFQAVPDETWTKSKTTYWEQQFIELLNSTIFSESRLPKDFLDTLKDAIR